jgi:hypothetical protein
MPRLNDTQMILLSAASQHDAGSLYPLPLALAGTGARIFPFGDAPNGRFGAHIMTEF